MFSSFLLLPKSVLNTKEAVFLPSCKLPRMNFAFSFLSYSMCCFSTRSLTLLDIKVTRPRPRCAKQRPLKYTWAFSFAHAQSTRTVSADSHSGCCVMRAVREQNAVRARWNTPGPSRWSTAGSDLSLLWEFNIYAHLHLMYWFPLNE